MSNLTTTNPLRELSDRKVASVSDLVSLTGKSRSTVRRHVLGERMPDKSDRQAYALAFGIDPAEFEKMWFPDLADKFVRTPAPDLAESVHP